MKKLFPFALLLIASSAHAAQLRVISQDEVERFEQVITVDENDLREEYKEINFQKGDKSVKLNLTIRKDDKNLIITVNAEEIILVESMALKGTPLSHVKDQKLRTFSTIYSVNPNEKTQGYGYSSKDLEKNVNENFTVSIEYL